MKKIIKENSKLILGFILGGLMFGGLTGLFAYALNASEVSFTPTDNNWKVNDTTVGDVKTALDDLYKKANDTIQTYQDLECPGCVFRKSTVSKCNVDSIYEGCTDEMKKLNEGEYTTDFKDLNSVFFLGHIIDNDGTILETYSCGLEQGKLLCLKSAAKDEINLAYRPNYIYNINKITSFMPNCNIEGTEQEPACCTSSICAATNISGSAYITGKYAPRCYAFTLGVSMCIE